jgi:excisionase family DNA binding protein
MTTPTIYPDDELCSIPEVAKALGVVTLTARIWVLRGRIPARDIGGGRLLVRRADLDRYMREMGHGRHKKQG